MRNYVGSISLSLVALVMTGMPSLAQEGGDLIALLKSDENAYVKSVQEQLSEAGYYSGKASGMLDKATIRAINKLCSDAQLLDECQVGPLSPDGAAAVVSALKETPSTLAASDQPIPETPAAEAEPTSPVTDAASADESAMSTTPAESAEEEAAPEPTNPQPTDQTDTVEGTSIGPEAWTATPGNGLSASLSNADGDLVAAIEGTATGRGWINLYAGPRLPVEAGVSGSFSLLAEATDLGGGTAKMRIAVQGEDGAYLGEIAPAVALGAKQWRTVEGVVPDGGKWLAPYIQVLYPVDEAAAAKIAIEAATVRVD